VVTGTVETVGSSVVAVEVEEPDVVGGLGDDEPDVAGGVELVADAATELAKVADSSSCDRASCRFVPQSW
jgi:hypothetical protein